MQNSKPLRQILSLLLIATVVAVVVWWLRSSRDDENLKTTAKAAIEAGQPQLAIDSLKLHLESNPEDTEARLGLARLLAVSAPDQALVHLKQIPRNDREASVAGKMIAGLLMQLDRNTEALIELRNLARKYPDDFAIRFSLAELLFQSRNYEQALTQIERAIELESNIPQSYDLLAHIYDELSRQQEMVEPLKKSLELNPNNANARLNLSYALRYSGRIDEAEEVARQIVREKPDWPKAWFELGVILKEQGDTENALEAVQKCLELDVDLFDARLLKTELHLFQARYSEAFDELRPLYPQMSSNRRFLALLSRAALLNGNDDFARELNERLQSLVESD